MRTDLLCFDCLQLYGGEEQRCPKIPNCRASQYPACDLAGDHERDMRGFAGEPRYVRGGDGNVYPAEYAAMYPYTCFYGR